MDAPRSNLQINTERQRALYLYLEPPLIAQLAKVHGLTVRDFAAIFGMGKSLAAQILNMTKYPDMVLALRIARYFEVTVDELWGWLVNDLGARRPLVIELPGTKRLLRLRAGVKAHGALALVAAMAEQMRREDDEVAGD
jgi:transcriptional regulator with XRE-family HTH domain